MRYFSKALAATALASASMLPLQSANAFGPGMTSGWTPVKRPAVPVSPVAVFLRALPGSRSPLPARWYPRPVWGYPILVTPVVRPAPTTSLPRKAVPLAVAVKPVVVPGWRPIPTKVITAFRHPRGRVVLRIARYQSPQRLVLRPGLVLRRG